MSKIYVGIGHGGADPGAVSGQHRESVYALDIGTACTAELRRHGLEVKQSRTQEVTHRLANKIKDCNVYAPDIAFDIHLNAGGGDGFEVFYSKNSEKGKAIAASLEKRAIAFGQNSRGIKTKLNSSGNDYFGFVRQVKCPSLLIECAFVDNKKDVQIVDSLEERKKFGKMLAWGILDYLKIPVKPEGQPSIGLNSLAKRLSGLNRVATSALIAQEGWKKVTNAIIASGYTHADALVGVPLAEQLGAPILLTGQDKLEKEIVDTLRELDVDKVYILGGEKAISAEKEAVLKQNYAVERIYGMSRIETAVEIAEKIQELSGTRAKKVYGVSVESFADALSVSAVAALEECPILYLPKSGEIPAAVKNFLLENSIELTVVGGPNTIDEGVIQSIEMTGILVDRIYGRNRYETCLEVCQEADIEGLFNGDGIAFATGKNYPDALAGAALCALEGIPLVLVDEGMDIAPLREFIESRDDIAFYVFGGENAVPSALINKILA